jgi:hypothetical protein
VIESVMVFALGFLAAALISLLIIPAVNARAERLARRRAEALFPMSISELTAEKDHLRAEFAVLQRKLERQAEDALATATGRTPTWSRISPRPASASLTAKRSSTRPEPLSPEPEKRSPRSKKRIGARSRS